MIAASDPVEETGLVHAVTVIQPEQMWTVIRGYDDFLAVAQTLLWQFANLPAFPEVAKHFHDSNSPSDNLLPIHISNTGSKQF